MGKGIPRPRLASTVSGLVGFQTLSVMHVSACSAPQAAISEICSPATVALAMALLSLQWSMGSIFGPTIGGLLAHPTTKYPWLLDLPIGPTLERFPFLLSLGMPMFVTAVTLLITYKFLPEPSHTAAAVPKPPSDTHQAAKDAAATSQPKAYSLRSLAVMSSVGLYALVCLCMGSYSTLFPLFLFTGTGDGGYGLNSSQVSWLLLSCAFVVSVLE